MDLMVLMRTLFHAGNPLLTSTRQQVSPVGYTAPFLWAPLSFPHGTSSPLRSATHLEGSLRASSNLRFCEHFHSVKVYNGELGLLMEDSQVQTLKTWTLTSSNQEN